MIKRLGTALLILFSALSVHAADKIPIAIMDMEAIDVPVGTARAVSDLIRTEIFNTGLFRVFERTEMEKVLKEQQFGQTGLSDMDSAIKVGKLLQAKKVLVGTVSKLGNSYIVNARIIDVERGEMEFADKAKSDSETDLDKAVESFARKIAKRIQGGAQPEGNQEVEKPVREKPVKEKPVIKEKPVEEENPVRRTEPSSGNRPFLQGPGLIIGISGLVIGGLGTVFNFVAKTDYTTYMGLFQPTDNYAQAWNKVNMDMTFRTVGWIGGGALLATGVVIMIIDSTHSSRTSAVPDVNGLKVVLTPGGTDLSYSIGW
jgi:TolB-like protein